MNQDNPFYAYLYMFKDNAVWKKFLTFFALTFCSLLPQMINEKMLESNLLLYFFWFLITGAIAIFAQLLFYGYFSSCIKSLIEQGRNYVLPTFNFKKDAIFGLKCFAGLFLIGLSVFLVILIAGLVFMFIMGCLAIVNKYIAIICTVLAAILTAIVLMIFSFMYYPVAMHLFAQTQDPLAFFNFKEMFRLIKTNFGTYCKYVGIIMLMSLAMIAVLLAFCFPICNLIKTPYFLVVISLFIALITPYLNMVYACAAAKCVK